MKIIESRMLLETPSLLTSETTRCDYVYSYPPRQAYRQLPDSSSPASVMIESLSTDNRANLYVHFPFCAQICSFCNLYSTVSTTRETHENYVSTLEREIEMRSLALPSIEVRTVYFGGGTPSLFDPMLLAKVLACLETSFSFRLKSVREVAIEVSPESATPDMLRELTSAGFNRINLGVQTTNANTLASIGRRHSPKANLIAVEDALQTDLTNVCVDLIYGLPTQNEATWIESLDSVIECRPHTICAYPLTVRQGTLYGRVGHSPDPVLQYRLYDIANARLTAAGYEQETHVRWSLPGQGGYLQKEYHWAGENLIGFGAGARSYLRSADVRNGYSIHPRKRALDVYACHIAEGQEPAIDGMLMNSDERRRKAVVLGLMNLDRSAFRDRYEIDALNAFPQEFQILEDRGLIECTEDAIRLTPVGTRHRDVIVQLFMSQQVTELVQGYDYHE